MSVMHIWPDADASKAVEEYISIISTKDAPPMTGAGIGGKARRMRRSKTCSV